MTHYLDTPVYDEVLDEAVAQAITDGDDERGDLLLDMDERTAPKPPLPGPVYNAPGSVFTADILAAAQDAGVNLR